MWKSNWVVLVNRFRYCRCSVQTVLCAADSKTDQRWMLDVVYGLPKYVNAAESLVAPFAPYCSINLSTKLGRRIPEPYERMRTSQPRK
jgi:hypothetical protein